MFLNINTQHGHAHFYKTNTTKYKDRHNPIEKT